MDHSQRSRPSGPVRAPRLTVLALALAFVAAVAACGSGEVDPEAESTPAPTTRSDAADGDDEDGGEGDSQGGDASNGNEGDDAAAETDCTQATASDIGVTEDTIRVGLVSVDITSLFGTGFVPEVTPENFFTRAFATFHAINEAGGINCRQVELVQVLYDPARSAETQVPACEQIAQDEEVFAVIAGYPDSAGGGIDCLWDRFGLPAVTTGPTPRATLDAAQGLIVAVRPSVEVMATTAASTFAELGLLDGEKIAVLGGDSGELGIARRIVFDRLDADGFDVVDVELPSSGGAVAVWGVVPQVAASLVQQEVTTVVMMDSNVTMAPLFNEMVSNGADWQWLAVDTQSAGGNATAAGMPDAWEATVVTTQTHELRTTDAGDIACIEDYESLRASGEFGPEAFEERRVEVGNTNTTRPLAEDCALAQVMAVGLANAGLNPTRASFVAGLNRAGPVEIGFETDGVLEPGKGYVSDTARVYSRYGPGAPECIELGYLEDLGCWGPYRGDDPGSIANIAPE